MMSAKLKSILGNKCPRCLEGEVFKTKNPYIAVLGHGGESHKECSHCGLKYEREPGFWYGAMYVSYAVGVAIFVAAWVATTVLLPEDTSIMWQIGIILLAILGLAPVNYFYSRMMWINGFVKYDENYAEQP